MVFSQGIRETTESQCGCRECRVERGGVECDNAVPAGLNWDWGETLHCGAREGGEEVGPCHGDCCTSGDIAQSEGVVVEGWGGEVEGTSCGVMT